jgi:hypothetical protein
MKMSNSEIRFVKYKDIDRTKWDQCIDNSTSGIVYATSWYLDQICSHWDALILGDYEYVMPLVNKRKYGIRYIYQPFFNQQLGVFSKRSIESELTDQFLEVIPKQFRFIDMNLNLGNTIKAINYSLKQNTTYHLNLRSNIGEIRNAYHSNTRRNIQKAIQQNIQIRQVSDIEDFLRFTAENLSLKSPEIKKAHYSALEKVISFALANQSGELLGAWDSEDNLIASVFFVRSNQTVIYLAASSNQSGTEKSAMFLLIDTFISQNAEKDLILDFEGSNIQGVARFYAGFGAIPKTYYSVHQNRLPKLLRIFKK